LEFELDDDQQELQRVVRDVVGRECPPELVRAVVAGGSDGDDLWKTLVGLDWPGLTVPVDDGGSGLTAVELVITLEELGWAADPTPFLATTSQYLPLVQECLDGEARRSRRAAVCAGRPGTVAFAALDVRAEPDGDGDGWVLHGTARAVIDGDRADEVLVVAALPDGDDDAARSVGVFGVPGGDGAATRAPAFDGALHVADLVLDGVPVAADRAFTGPGVAAGVERARHVALAGIGATTVGACRRILELVLAHVKDRHQFGVPIGSFQAVKHMAVDVYVAIERARALVHFAALAAAEDDPRRALAASMAKAAAGDAQRLAVRHGIQLFGGLGFTWENDLQIYVRRAMAGELLLGTAADHRALVGTTALAALAALAAPSEGAAT
jgi:alkylation response protein AidB-like acyl-CoA dehydrogenase